MTIVLRLLLLLGLVTATSAFAQPAGKPNILVIWGDDIGQFNKEIISVSNCDCKR